MDEQRLERALREGPQFATRYVPSALALDEPSAARRPASVGRLVPIIAVTAFLLAGMLAGLAAIGAFSNDRGGANEWLAFATWDGTSTSWLLPDRDIHLVREGQAARRIIGTDSDNLDQICPAFSPDGRHLAYGQAEGRVANVEVGPGGEEIPHDSTYRHAALVIADLDADGNASESQVIEVGGSFPPPCATWSADGQRVAFGVSLTNWRSPLEAVWGSADLTEAAPGSEVWIVSLESARIDVISDLFASDLEWSPDGSELAIASHVAGESLRDGAISLYAVGSGELQTLVGPTGVSSLSWSPDGTRIAFQRRSLGGTNLEILVAEVDGSAEYLLASGFSAVHGLGPAWSPTGEWIVYQPHQPNCEHAPCYEASDVVLIPAGGELGGRDPGDGQVVLPPLVLPDDAEPRFPYRVTWSPDGKELLYAAWGGGGEDEASGNSLIAVPVDSSSPAEVLYEGSDERDISVYGGEGMLPTQSWATATGE